MDLPDLDAQNVKLQPLWKTVGQFLKKLNPALSTWPSSSSPGNLEIQAWEKKPFTAEKKPLRPHVQVAQASTDRTHVHNVTRPQNGRLSGRKKNGVWTRATARPREHTPNGMSHQASSGSIHVTHPRKARPSDQRADSWWPGVEGE